VRQSTGPGDTEGSTACANAGAALEDVPSSVDRVQAASTAVADPAAASKNPRLVIAVSSRIASS
jgi:hypothetical protein